MNKKMMIRELKMNDYAEPGGNTGWGGICRKNIDRQGRECYNEMKKTDDPVREDRKNGVDVAQRSA